MDVRTEKTRERGVKHFVEVGTFLVILQNASEHRVNNSVTSSVKSFYLNESFVNTNHVVVVRLCFFPSLNPKHILSNTTHRPKKKKIVAKRLSRLTRIQVYLGGSGKGEFWIGTGSLVESLGTLGASS